MGQRVIEMRPHEFSPELQEVAEALLPLVRKMLRDPSVVFTRPECLAKAALPTSAPTMQKKKTFLHVSLD